MGDLDKIAARGGSKMYEKQVGVWEAGGLASVKIIPLQQSTGAVMPYLVTSTWLSHLLT